MKRILTSNAKPGMKLAKDAFTETGKLVTKKGTELTEEIIDKLRRYSMFSLFIYDENGEDESIVNSRIIEKSKSIFMEKAMNSVEYKNFARVFKNTVDELQSVFQVVAKGECSDKVDELMNSVNLVVNNINNNPWLFGAIHYIEGYDDQTYAHSISVAITSNIFARWMKMSKDEINQISVAGLLHDIGKVMMPLNIIQKPGRLSPAEYEIIKAHPTFGYKLLEAQKVKEEIRRVALEHHERSNGTGYPDGKVSEQIGFYSKIVAIADIYDAMTADRIYREGVCPFDVIALFLGSMEAYDTEILLTVMERLANYFVNMDVLLNETIHAKVVMINKNALAKPMVILDNNQVLDLSKTDEYTITSIA